MAGVRFEPMTLQLRGKNRTATVGMGFGKLRGYYLLLKFVMKIDVRKNIVVASLLHHHTVATSKQEKLWTCTLVITD